MSIFSKRNARIALAILLFFMIAFYFFYRKNELLISVSPSQDIEVISKQNSKVSDNSDNENESISTEHAGNINKESLDLKKVIDDAVSFQSFIYPSLPGLSSNTEGVGQPMDPVFLLSYMDSGVDKIIVPFAHGGQVISLAFMRSNSFNEYKPDQLIDVSEKNWTQYPPLSSAEAEQRFSDQYPLEPYQRISGLYHLGYPTPFYQYKSLQDSGRRFLVNAVSGTVTEAPPPIALEEQAEARKAVDMPPIRQTDDGLIEIVEERAHEMSSRERQQLEKEIAESNRAIEDGLLKIGPDFEVIYDKR